jgi:hypothetical protein
VCRVYVAGWRFWGRGLGAVGGGFGEVVDGGWRVGVVGCVEAKIAKRGNFLCGGNCRIVITSTASRLVLRHSVIATSGVN